MLDYALDEITVEESNEEEPVPDTINFPTAKLVAVAAVVGAMGYIVQAVRMTLSLIRKKGSDDNCSHSRSCTTWNIHPIAGDIDRMVKIVGNKFVTSSYWCSFSALLIIYLLLII